MITNIQTAIQKEIRTKTGALNLNESRLTEIPEELLHMEWLETLSLQGNEIEEIKNFDNLKNLKYLNLNQNRIKRIKNIGHLEALVSLEVMINQIKEVEGLDLLSNLKHLRLDFNFIESIKGIENIKSLEVLSLNSNKIKDWDSLQKIVEMPNLKTLLTHNIISDYSIIPYEHFSYDDNINSLDSLKGYFDAIKQGAKYLNEVMLILTGNSTAGKTSLRWLLTENNLPPIDYDYSTHGVETTAWIPNELVLKLIDNNSINLKDIRFYICDFGGQEYFHATHRLFFSQNAIYILLWEVKTNNQSTNQIKLKIKTTNSVKETSLQVEMFPYNYWLKNIRLYAPNYDTAPILMVQNKIDQQGNSVVKYIGDSERDLYGIVETFSLSLLKANETKPNGREYKEYERFLTRLLELVQDKELARQTYWDEIKHTISNRKSENIWSAKEFHEVLKSFDRDISNLGALSYKISLNDIGFVFYYNDDEYLKDYVFINPDWVINSIYNILNRDVLESNGEFDKLHISNQIGTKDTEVFINLMKKFQLIFENEEDQVYIAPQYLPKLCTEAKALRGYMAALPDNGNASSVSIYFPDFMPQSIIQRLIAAFGNKAEGKIYWKYGGLFLLDNKHVLIESKYLERKLIIKAKDHDNYLKWKVFQEISKIIDGDEDIWVSLDNEKNFASLKDISQQIILNNLKANVKSLNDGLISISNYLFLFQKQMTPKQSETDKKPINIFISYAHTDKDYFQVFVNEFQEQLNNSREYTFNSFDDRQIELGEDWNERLMNEVNRCDVGILLLSASFINSKYITEQELKVMLEKLEQEKGFIICPIYFRAFQFSELAELKKYQFFKPDGSAYGHADKATNLCFADLVSFYNVNGTNLASPNPNRDRYLLDLKNALFTALNKQKLGG